MITRIITGVVLLVAALAGIFYLSVPAFSRVAIVIVSVAAWEFAALMWKQDFFRRSLFLIVFVSFAIITYFLSARMIIFCGVVWWFLVPGLLWYYARNQQLLFASWAYQFGVGILVFIPFVVSLITVRRFFGVEYLLCGLMIVWAADVGAYFSGKFFGKHLLALAISPKKTLEGLGGGLILAMLVAMVWGMWFKITGVHWLFWLTLTLVVSLWSVIGDLFESVLKRYANVKDSGAILPGHGGVYDRIDSLTAALPLFVFGLLLARL